MQARLLYAGRLCEDAVRGGGIRSRPCDELVSAAWACASMSRGDGESSAAYVDAAAAGVGGDGGREGPTAAAFARLRSACRSCRAHWATRSFRLAHIGSGTVVSSGLDDLIQSASVGSAKARWSAAAHFASEVSVIRRQRRMLARSMMTSGSQRHMMPAGPVARSV